MTEASKKITYTSEFKLKVLDYYFKNGGDENFGLKKKTASHFNINKKTINRLLNNPDMVKRARKLVAKRIPPTGVRTVAKPRTSTAKTPVKGSSKASTGSRVGTSGGARSSSMPNKTANTVGQNSSSSSATSKAPTSSVSTNKPSGSSNTKSGSGVGSGAQAAHKPSTSKTRCTNQEVLELPEDPDYSLLKRSINASSNGVANIAKVLVSGTDEVRKMLLNECDMILECKVCRNLFRSLVNFLAHKRIYCQDEYANVRTLFHKDPVQGITSQSQTVIVEPTPPPEPPDWHPPPLNPTSNSSHPNANGSNQADPVGKTGIDSIAEMLASRRQQLSHPTHTGSSQYYKRLEETNCARNRLSEDCSVVLEDISGVTSARYQTFTSPSTSTSTTTPSVPMTAMLDQVAQFSAGVTVAVDENGEVMKTARGDVTSMTLDDPASPSNLSEDLLCRLCNTRFATQKTLSVHQRSHHGLERCVYVCPICQATFLSMWAVVKHLQRSHKKTKHQIERLRKVIRKNVYKKMVFPSVSGKKEGERKDGKGPDEEEEEEEEEMEEEEEVEEDEEEGMEEEESTNCEPAKMEAESKPSTPQKLLHPQPQSHRKSTPVKSPTKGWRSKGGVRWSCNVCHKMFVSRATSLAHVATHITCDFEPRAELVSVETETAIDETSEKPQEESEQEITSSDSDNEESKAIRERECDWEYEAGENQALLLSTSPRKTKRKNPDTVHRISLEDQPGDGTVRDCGEKEKEVSKASSAVKGTTVSDDMPKLEDSENIDKAIPDPTVPPKGVSESLNVASGLSLTDASQEVLDNKVDSSGSVVTKKVTDSPAVASSLSEKNVSKEVAAKRVAEPLQKYVYNQVLKKKVDCHTSVAVASGHKKEESTGKLISEKISARTATQSKPEKSIMGTPTRVSGDTTFSSNDMAGELDPILNPLFTCLETRYSSVSTKSPLASRSEADVHQSATELRLFEDCGDEESPDQEEAGTSHGSRDTLKVAECTSGETDVKRECEGQRSYKRERNCGERNEKQKVFKGKKRKVSCTGQKEEKETPTEKKETDCEENEKMDGNKNVEINNSSKGKEGGNAELLKEEKNVVSEEEEKLSEERNINDETKMEWGKAEGTDAANDASGNISEGGVKQSDTEANSKESERKRQTPTESAEVQEGNKFVKTEMDGTCINERKERHCYEETKNDCNTDSSTIISLENPCRKQGSSLVENGTCEACEKVGRCGDNTGEQVILYFSQGNLKIGCEAETIQHHQSALMTSSSAGVLEILSQSEGPAESIKDKCAPSVSGTAEKGLGSSTGGTGKNDEVEVKLTEESIKKDDTGLDDVSVMPEKNFSEETLETKRENTESMYFKEHAGDIDTCSAKDEVEMSDLEMQELEVKFEVEDQDSVTFPVNFEVKEENREVSDDDLDIKEEPISPEKGKAKDVTMTSSPIPLQERGDSEQSPHENIFKETGTSGCHSNSKAQREEDRSLSHLSTVPAARFPLLSLDDMEYFQSLVGEVSTVKYPTAEQGKDAIPSSSMMEPSPSTLCEGSPGPIPPYDTHRTTSTPSDLTPGSREVSSPVEKESSVPEKEAVVKEKHVEIPQVTRITTVKHCPDSDLGSLSPSCDFHKTVEGDVKSDSKTPVQQSHQPSQSLQAPTSIACMSSEKLPLKSVIRLEDEKVSQSHLLTIDAPGPAKASSGQPNTRVTENLFTSDDGVSKQQFLTDSAVNNKASSNADTKAPDIEMDDISGDPNTKQAASTEGKIDENSDEAASVRPRNPLQMKKLPTSAADVYSVVTSGQVSQTNPVCTDIKQREAEPSSEVSALPVHTKASHIRTYSLCSKVSTPKPPFFHRLLVQDSSTTESSKGNVSGTCGSNSGCNTTLEENVDTTLEVNVDDDDVFTSKSLGQTSTRLIKVPVDESAVEDRQQSETRRDALPSCTHKGVITQKASSGLEATRVGEARESERQTCQRRESKETNRSTGMGYHQGMTNRFLKQTEIKLKTVSIRKDSAAAHISPRSSISICTGKVESPTMSSDSQVIRRYDISKSSISQSSSKSSASESHFGDGKVGDRDTHLGTQTHKNPSAVSQVLRTEVDCTDGASCSSISESSHNKTLQRRDIEATRTVPAEEKLPTRFLSMKRPREERDNAPSEETELTTKRVKNLETAVPIKSLVSQKSKTLEEDEVKSMKFFQVQRVDRGILPCTNLRPSEVRRDEEHVAVCRSDQEQTRMRLFSNVKEEEDQDEQNKGIIKYVTKPMEHSMESKDSSSQAKIGTLKPSEATSSNLSVDSDRTVLAADPTDKGQSHAQTSKDNIQGDSCKKSAGCSLKKVKAIRYVYRQRDDGVDLVAVPSECIEDPSIEKTVIDTEDVLHDPTTFGDLSYDYDLH